MTGSRGSSSAMARRPLAVALGVLALVAIGECLACKVCIPPITGDTPSKKEAEQWRAKISRTFNNKAEDDFQVCGEPEDISKPQPEDNCPWNTDDEVCLDIKHDTWQALTCGKVPTDMDLQCGTSEFGGAFVCPCSNNYCNSRGWRGAAASVTLISALLCAALAAAW